MEQLRNVAHHAGFSVRILRYNRGKEGGCENYNATPYIRVYDLQRNKKLKKWILDEIKKRGDDIDLKYTIRSYIESIGKIHVKYRGLLKIDIDSWEAEIDYIFKSYNKATGSHEDDLQIVEQNEDGSYAFVSFILTSQTVRRQNLDKRNLSLDNLTRKYITNQIEERKP